MHVSKGALSFSVQQLWTVMFFLLCTEAIIGNPNEELQSEGANQDKTYEVHVHDKAGHTMRLLASRQYLLNQSELS